MYPSTRITRMGYNQQSEVARLRHRQPHACKLRQYQWTYHSCRRIIREYGRLGWRNWLRTFRCGEFHGRKITRGASCSEFLVPGCWVITSDVFVSKLCYIYLYSACIEQFRAFSKYHITRRKSSIRTVFEDCFVSNYRRWINNYIKVTDSTSTAR
ncbi:hypothetical protein OBBRIDRAFT_172165 [Obba rivulosa]|uniref:Uncharacterized protein n=1 Tax=Obba rivulosa TaxID=1052685 RepID=A0A8E2AV23_9APHY|nr:hypothetical protein OBBRIDRAFT_172165 [Obba rivulosa]